MTASQDGHVKFWKKQESGIEFVKHFRAHLGKGSLHCETLWMGLFAGKILDMSASPDGLLLCTTSEDKALKIFDVINFGR